MAMMTAAGAPSWEYRHGRAQSGSAQAGLGSNVSEDQVERCGPQRRSGRALRAGHLLGAAGGSGASHIVQFRPVGVERPGKELAPEATQLGERACRASAAVRRGGKGCRSDRCHDAGSPFSLAAFAALEAHFGAEVQLWPDLLKDSFNCRDSPHTWYPSRIHPVNEWKTRSPAVALWGARRYISGSKFP